MFGLALLASCMPCHDDWLNERSSTPPVSSTMHSVAEPVEAGLLTGALAGADDAGVLGVEAAGTLDAGVLLELDAELDGLLLHAVIARATMPVAAMTWTVFFTTPPVSFADRSIRGRAGLRHR